MNEFMRRFDDEHKTENEFLTNALQEYFGSDLDKSVSALAVMASAVILGGYWKDKSNLLPLLLDRIRQSLEQPSERFLATPQGAGFDVDRLFDEAGIRNAAEAAALKEMFYAPSTRKEVDSPPQPSEDHRGRSRFRWW